MESHFRSRSLHQLEGSRRQSACIVALLLGCTGLIVYSHFGLSAQVITNAPVLPSGRRRLATNQCSAADEAAFTSGGGRSTDPANPSTFDTMLATCGASCGLAAIQDATCGTTCVTSTGVYTAACTACIGDYGFCSASQCLAQCIGGVTAACVTCVTTNCAASLYSCTGFTAPSAPQGPSAPGGSGSGLPWRNVGGDADITLFTAVHNLYDADAYALGTVLVVASGVKPYAECLMLFLIWFVPLPRRLRGQMLRWINRGSRWSLMDNFLVMVMCSAIDFSLLSGSVRIVMETRAAIYTFATMAMVLTPIGEWMTFRATAHAGAQDEADPAHLGCLARPLCGALDAPLQRDALKPRSPLLLLTAPAAWALTIAALFVPHAIKWELTDLTTGGTAVSEHTFASLISGAMTPVTESAAGGVYLAVVFFFAVLMAPIGGGLAMVIVAVAPAGHRVHTYALRTAQALNPYASLDVLMLGLLAFATEFERLIFSLTEAVAGSAGTGAVTAKAAIGPAIYIAIPAIVLTWAAQIVTAVHAATAESKSSTAHGQAAV